MKVMVVLENGDVEHFTVGNEFKELVLDTLEDFASDSMYPEENTSSKPLYLKKGV